MSGGHDRRCDKEAKAEGADAFIYRRPGGCPVN